MKKSILAIFILVYQLTFAVVPPTGESEQHFCAINVWTLLDIEVSSTTNDVFWFNINDNSGTPLPNSTELQNGFTYYAFESLNINETSLFVTVYLEELIPAPTGNSEQYYCSGGANTLADLLVDNTVGYSQLFYYSDSGQTGEPLPLTTELQDGSIYYTFQSIYRGGCSVPLAITVVESTIPAPVGEGDPFFCYEPGFTLEDVAVFNTQGFDSIYWYADAEQTELLNPFTIDIEDSVTYYATQAEGCNCGCVLLLPVTIHLYYPAPAPIGELEQTYCLADGVTLSDLQVFNTAGYDNLFYFSNYDLDTPLSPNTELENEVTYYITQAYGICDEILTVTVNLLESTPLPNIDSNMYFCNDVETTLEDIVPNVYWFNQPSNLGTPLETSLVVTDNTTFYIFSDLSICAQQASVTTHLIDCSTSNVDEELLNTFAVFPNPTNNNLTIKTNDISSEIQIVINDISGRKVFSKSLHLIDNTTSVDVSNLEANLYFISLITTKGISTQKFVKK